MKKTTKTRKGLAVLLTAVTVASLIAGCSANYETSIDTNYRTLDTSPSVENTAPAYPADMQETFLGPSLTYDDFNTEEYSAISENGFIAVRNNPLSTFAADADTASYGNLRRYLRDGSLPPKDAIRTEELINYFRYAYPEPTSGDILSCSTELVRCPWNDDTLLLRIGLATEDIDTSDLPGQNLVFLIDVSGSMCGSDRLDLVKRAFLMLCEELDEDDTVSIVTYASNDQIVLDGVSGGEKAAIMNAIDTLDAGGGTNGSAGIQTAYELASKHFIKGGNNRIILATDGDLNLGVTSEGELKRLVEENRKSGVYLSVMGFGSGNIKDNKMETLADNGNGNYTYIDSIDEARKTLIEEMGATLHTVAKDVKLQVEFNPGSVKGYRLIGYENRIMAAEDFNNDEKDGGELGAGRQMTALYEIVPAGSDIDVGEIDLKYQDTPEASGSGELCTVKVRYQPPEGGNSTLCAFEVENNISDKMSPSTALAAAVTETAMLIRGSEYAGSSSYEDVMALLGGLDYTVRSDYTDEFLGMVRSIAEMQ